MAVFGGDPFFRLLTDAGSAPAAGWKIYTYEPGGTTTPKSTYKDAAQTLVNTNPVILDSAGYANIQWDGRYTIIVKDENDVTKRSINDYDPQTFAGVDDVVTFTAASPTANKLEIESAETGFGPTIRSIGSDGNIDINIETEGSGEVNIDATINVDGDGLFTGDVEGVHLDFSGTGNIDGAVTFGSTLAVTGTLASGALTVTGTSTLNGNTAVTGTLSATGNLSSTGTSHSLPVLLTVPGNSSSAGALRLGEDSDNGSNYVELKAPDSLAANYTLTALTALPGSTEFVTVNSSGQLATSAGSGSTAVTVIDSGTFSGVSAIVLNGLTTDYKKIVIDVMITSSSGTSGAQLRLLQSPNNGSSYNTTSNYRISGGWSGSATSLTQVAARYEMTGNSLNNTLPAVHLSIEMANHDTTAYTSYITNCPVWTSSSTIHNYTTHCIVTTAEVTNTVHISVSAGTITGSYRVYGYN